MALCSLQNCLTVKTVLAWLSRVERYDGGLHNYENLHCSLYELRAS